LSLPLVFGFFFGLGAPAAGTTQYMDMGTARPLKDTGDEDLVFLEPGAAYRAYPGPVSVQAIGTAFDVHKPVFTGKRRVRQGFDQFSFFQPGGTDRAGLGSAGNSRTPGRFFGFPPFPAVKTEIPQGGKKKGIPKPQEGDPYHRKR
jgi:hypothetical protein